MNTDAITRDDASTIPQLFESFPTVENLSVYLSAIESFSQYGVPRVLRASMVHIKHAYIDNMSFVPAYGLQIVLFLIRSSPNLEKLKLKILEDPAFVESRGCSFRSEDYPEILLEHLKVLEIFYLSNEKPQIDFVQFVIARSSVLEKVRIILFDAIDDDEELEISEILLGFARASPVVEITVEKEVFRLYLHTY
ncbi:uncharacterized protein LOC110883637 [Helianthus annuus]|nr:uncharacterized protein LOC110883637 [Helianthus annuus]